MVSWVRCGTLLYQFLIFAFSLTLLNIDKSYFEKKVSQIYVTELQLKNANSSATEDPILGFGLLRN